MLASIVGLISMDEDEEDEDEDFESKPKRGGKRAPKAAAAKKKKARLVDYLTAVLLNILAVIPVLFSAPYLQEKVIFLILMHRSILNPLNLIYCKNMEVLLL